MEKEVVIYNKLCNKHIKVLDKHLFNKILYIELQGALRECYIKKVVTEYDGYFLYSSIVLNMADMGEYTLDTNKSIAQSNAWKLYLSVRDYKDKKYYYNGQCMTNVEVHQILNRIFGKNCIKIDQCNGNRCLSTYQWNGVKPIEVYPKLPNVIIQDVNGFHFDIDCELPQYYASKEECEKDNTIKVIKFDFDKKLEEYDKLNSKIEPILNSLRKCLLEQYDYDQFINYMTNELSKVF